MSIRLHRRTLTQAIDANAYGVTADGVTDDTAALRAVVTSANGREVILPKGRIRAPGPINAASFGTIPVNVVGHGPGETVIVQDADARVIDVRGADSGSPILLTSDAAVAATTLTITSTAGLGAGDFLRLKSTVTWPGTLDGAVYEELVRIGSVDSGTQLTLRGPIDESYAVANGASVTKLSFVNDVRIRGLTIENSAPGTRTAVALYIERCRNILIEDYETIGLDGSAVRLKYAVDWRVKNGLWRDSTDDAANGRYGYGAEIGASCRDGIVSGCSMRRGRHLVTTGAGTGEGPPRHITVAKCIAAEMTSAAYDTHEEGRFIHFNNCAAHGLRSRAFNVRAPDVTISVGRAYGIFGSSSLRVDPNAVRCKINDYLAREIKRDTSTSEAISIAADDCAMSVIRVEESDGAGILVAANADRFRLTDGSFIRVGRFTTTARYGVHLLGTSTDHVLRNVYVESDQSSAVGIKAVANVSNWVVDGLTTKLSGGGTSKPLEYDAAFPPRVAAGSIVNVGTGAQASVDVASVAGTITLPDWSDYINLTGVNAVTGITASWVGRVVYVKYASTATLTDGGNLKLAASVVGTADDVVALLSDGTNWYQIAPASVN